MTRGGGPGEWVWVVVVVVGGGWSEDGRAKRSAPQGVSAPTDSAIPTQIKTETGRNINVIQRERERKEITRSVERGEERREEASVLVCKRERERAKHKDLRNPLTANTSH